MDRCDECGSWEAQCGSDAPIKDCGCSRCLAVENKRLRKEIRELEIQKQALSELISLTEEMGGYAKEFRAFGSNTESEESK